VVDQGLQCSSPSPSQQPQASTHFFEVFPANETRTALVDSYIKEVPDDDDVRKAYDSYQLALAYHKEKSSKVTPTSTCTTLSTTPVGNTFEKKAPQFQYKLKVKDSVVAQQVFN